MARLYRYRCVCGEVSNIPMGGVCPNCKRAAEFPQGGQLVLYRKGSPLGIAGGFGIYIDEIPMGYIGNKETVFIPLSYGKHKLHMAVGMNRKCTDPIIDITQESPVKYAKVWMKPGFISNTFVIEEATADEMPEK